VLNGGQNSLEEGRQWAVLPAEGQCCGRVFLQRQRQLENGICAHGFQPEGCAGGEGAVFGDGVALRGRPLPGAEGRARGLQGRDAGGESAAKHCVCATGGGDGCGDRQHGRGGGLILARLHHSGITVTLCWAVMCS